MLEPNPSPTSCLNLTLAPLRACVAKSRNHPRCGSTARQQVAIIRAGSPIPAARRNSSSARTTENRAIFRCSAVLAIQELPARWRTHQAPSSMAHTSSTRCCGAPTDACAKERRTAVVAGRRQIGSLRFEGPSVYGRYANRKGAKLLQQFTRKEWAALRGCSSRRRWG